MHKNYFRKWSPERQKNNFVSENNLRLFFDDLPILDIDIFSPQFFRHAHIIREFVRSFSSEEFVPKRRLHQHGLQLGTLFRGTEYRRQL
jgi:hypothetical protein